MALAAELLKDPERKSIFRMAAEVVFLYFYHKEIPRHYFSRYLFKEGRNNIADYLPGKFLYRIKSKFNEEDARDVLENKLYFDFYYRQFKFPLPKILMYNQGKLFVASGLSFELNDAASFREALKNLLANNTSYNSIFVKKTYWSYGGTHIFKIAIDDLGKDSAKIDEIYRVVTKTGYLFQETVRQHSELERFNPSCLNTIRFDTFIDKDGRIDIISAYFRTNIKNHYTDNDPEGGCEIPINLESGKLKKYGYLTLKSNGLKLPFQHPMTRVMFENFEIPHFEQAKELVLEAARYVPSLRLVGWDVAIGETGPILIEGNSDYAIPASDLSYGGYRKNPIFQKVLKEIGYR
jgi:hypothetical protein